VSPHDVVPHYTVAPKLLHGFYKRAREEADANEARAHERIATVDDLEGLAHQEGGPETYITSEEMEDMISDLHRPVQRQRSEGNPTRHKIPDISTLLIAA
jgi:hypothetical protein